MRSLPRKFVPACIIERETEVPRLKFPLIARWGRLQPAAGCSPFFRPLLFLVAFCCAIVYAGSPLLVVPNGDPKQWQPVAQGLGWQLATPAMSNIAADKGMQDFESAVKAAIGNEAVDPARVYLAGPAADVPAIFYIASRWPEPWAAAVALGGTPRPAIDTNRLFGINTRLVPVLWISGKNNEAAPMAEKLKAAEYNLEVRESATPQEIFAWLAAHHGEAIPPEIDCETDSPAFPRCYWIEMTKFDAAERNDVLTSTRVQAGSGAALDLGGFGFNPQAEGPGILVTWLPEHYSGPLKLNDRIVSIGGVKVRDAREYVEQMDKTTEEKPVAVMVERGKDHMRLETRIVMPRRPSSITARVQGQRLLDLKQVQIVSRAVTQMRVTLPAEWLPAVINWNGSEVVTADAPGCWLLDVQKELMSGKKCP